MLSRLPILILHPHSRCNCRCVMCDIWKAPDATEISAADLARHVDSLSEMQVEWAVFSGGEPLMHSDLFRLCAVLRTRGIRVTILSTGLLLARHAAAIVADVDDVIVSLDGPAAIHNSIRRVTCAFEMLSAGVRAIRTLNPAFPISARCTVQRLNYAHLSATIAAARDLRLNQISFLAADLTSTAFNRPAGWAPDRQSAISLAPEDLPVLDAEMESIITHNEWREFVAESPDKLRRIARHFRAHLGLIKPEAPPCNAPWVSVVLEADGTVRPCFFHPPIGKVDTQTTLMEVVNSDAGIRFRAALDVESNPICQRCVCSLNRPGV